MKKFRITAFILALSTSVAFATAASYAVYWQGSLRAIHGGDFSGKVPLLQFADRMKLYAVGPIANLGGEIAAIAGKFYIARVKHGDLMTDRNLSTEAGFLVWSEVAAWTPPVPLGETADSHVQIERQIEALATKAGIDTSKPFPFRLEGVLNSVDYHVLVAMTHQQAQASHSDGAMKISRNSADAEAIGFSRKATKGYSRTKVATRISTLLSATAIQGILMKSAQMRA